MDRDLALRLAAEDQSQVEEVQREPLNRCVLPSPFVVDTSHGSRLVCVGRGPIPPGFQMSDTDFNNLDSRIKSERSVLDIPASPHPLLAPLPPRPAPFTARTAPFYRM